MNETTYKELLEIKEAIIEESIANKSLALMLKKELRKNEKLQAALEEVTKDRDFYKHWYYDKDRARDIAINQNEFLKDQNRTLSMERNLLLRKIKLEACDCVIKYVDQKEEDKE